MAESLHSVMSPSTLTGSPIPSHSLATKEGISPPSRPFSKRFCQAGDPEVTQARAIYLKTYMTGLFTVIAPDLQSLMSVSPQTVINPVSYTIVNLVPFNQPVYAFLYLYSC